ncbi:MAG: methyltransferase domain-containing protein [Deltaproteobacteria bacterium]|nr:methyltransferase domain-containing protein [Deltaproteobacteria bacterium]
MTSKTNPLSQPEPWNLVAQGYANKIHWVMEPFARLAIELVDLDSHSLVLDLACGPGTLSLQLAPKVKHVTAVDFSKAMLGQLSHLKKSLVLDNITLVHGDGQDLDLTNHSFDAAFSMFGLMFFPDRLKGFSQIRRVLKPGAKAVISSWAPIERSPMMRLLFGSLQAIEPSIEKPEAILDSLENPEVFSSEMKQAGFSKVEIKEHTLTLPKIKAEDFWKNLVESAVPLVMLRRKMGETIWQERSKKAIDYLHEQFEGRTQALSTTAFLGVGYA